ncbi:hypothetical protein BLNAU_9658 [Blattamonas nauphoetae]|uniref:Uncharacterized protein n=1 Tax=Blattamonas nauphoetae TaxID=2049346 RepID=A0ABQ9XVE2_9EUKA|nr:hypothetical protein BLNAU_9658 [Blattamonas nauphoetae]
MNPFWKSKDLWATSLTFISMEWELKVCEERLVRELLLQTLSSHSGIPSLVTPLPAELNKATLRRMMAEDIPHSRIHLLSLCVRSMASGDFFSSTIAPSYKFLMKMLLSPFPAVVSASFEFFHRFVSVSSDAVRIELLKRVSTSHTVHPELIINESLLLNHVGDLDPTEKFHSSLFDEADNEILTRSLIRCNSVCGLVGADQCILDPPTFFDRTVSVLGSSNSKIRTAAMSLFSHLNHMPSVVPQFPSQSNRLHFAFRDGRPEEQHALIWISMMWINKVIFEASLPPFAWTQFDWDWLNSADLSWKTLLLDSLDLLMSLRFCTIMFVDQTKATEIFLSFERQQRAVPRINSMFRDLNHRTLNDKVVEVPVTCALLVSLLTKCDFPHTITAFLTTHPDIDLSG